MRRSGTRRYGQVDERLKCRYERTDGGVESEESRRSRRAVRLPDRW
jgi:hypothetical protein